jgi:hypothetical protein
VFGQDEHHQADVPGVLGVIFRAATIDQDGLAEDFLEPVNLPDEADLLNQTRVNHV